MQTAREHPRQSGAIGPSDPPAESFIPQTGGPGNASFSFVSLATAASFGFGLRTILLDHDRGNDAGMPKSVPRADRIGVAKRLESAPKPHLGRSLTRDKILVRRSTDPLRSLAMSCRRVTLHRQQGGQVLAGRERARLGVRVVGGDDLALPDLAVAVELAGAHHPAEGGARARPARPPRRGTPCRRACAPAPPARSRRRRASRAPPPGCTRRPRR